MNSTIHPDLLKRFEGYETISFTTLSTTDRLVDKLYTTAKNNNLWWYSPLLNRYCYREERGVVLEWWNKQRKYSIYVAEDQINYIAVWGKDMYNEMEDGNISLDNDLTDFWKWIAE